MYLDWAPDVAARRLSFRPGLPCEQEKGREMIEACRWSVADRDIMSWAYNICHCMEMTNSLLAEPRASRLTAH
jgi:hypothetical protein